MKNQTEIDTLFETGIELFHEGKWSEAESKFQQGLLLDLGESDIFRFSMMLGHIKREQGVLQAAREFYNQAYVSGGSQNPYLLVKYGVTECDLDHWDTARELLLSAYMLEGEEVFKGEESYLERLKNDPDINSTLTETQLVIDAITQEGNELYDEGKLAEAENKFKEVLSMNLSKSQMMWFCTMLGDIKREQGELQAAVDYYTQAHTSGGYANPYVLLMYGVTACDLDHWDRARELLLGAYMLEGEELFTDYESYLERLWADPDVKRPEPEVE